MPGFARFLDFTRLMLLDLFSSSAVCPVIREYAQGACPANGATSTCHYRSAALLEENPSMVLVRTKAASVHIQACHMALPGLPHNRQGQENPGISEWKN